MEEPEQASAEDWFRVSGFFRLCGWASEADRKGQSPQRFLDTIATSPVMYRVRLESDVQDEVTLWQRTREIFRAAKADLSLPISNNFYDRQAILCWALHVADGFTLTEIGRMMSVGKPASGEPQFVTPLWGDGKTTTYERMWISGDTTTTNVTIKALPGLLHLAHLWSVSLGINLGAIQPAPTPIKARVPRMGTRPLPGDQVTWVDDVSIPDGSVLEPGQEFVKIWRVRNSGTVEWKDRFLTRVGVGNGISLPRSAPSVELPYAAPGDTIDIAFPMVAQTQPGQVHIMFKQTDEYGRLYFPGSQYHYGIYCEYVVTHSKRRIWSFIVPALRRRK